MLSALAKFIFGGIINDVPEESLQCETREVNDWLLVNLPNQTDNDIEELERDDDSDDILTSLPRLLMLESSYDRSFCDVISPSILYEHPLDTRIATQSSFLNECPEDFQILPESLYIGHSFYYPSEFSLVVSQCFSSPECNGLLNPDQSVLIIEDKRVHATHSKTVVINSKDAKVQNLPDKRICHPAALSRNYVNHRSPVFSARTELLEQIEVLKPKQQAIEYELKKQVSRSQLNRQNKNYIYETSAKTNRRKNLWRHHSGANNNRKC